jgi:pilus assembly protein Flp/PilA
MLNRFLRNERGATAIEYGLIAAILFLGIVTAIGNYGDAMSSMYDKIRTAVGNVVNGT